jgi:hypothetical protein
MAIGTRTLKAVLFLCAELQRNFVGFVRDLRSGAAVRSRPSVGSATEE